MAAAGICDLENTSREDIVARVEVADETLYGHARLRNFAAHAARAIYYDPDRHRRIEIPAQELNGPLDAVDVKCGCRSSG